MPDSFEPNTAILPKAQQEIWPLLAPTPGLSFVLYGGTAAVALHLGYRISVPSISITRYEGYRTSIAFMRDGKRQAERQAW
jgi:hypothetical protein